MTDRAIRWTAAAAVLVLCLSAAARAQAPIDSARVDSIVRAQMAAKHIIGVSIGMMQNGRVVFARGYGVRDLTSREPVTPQTMFAIGSVTKQFTCSSLLMLQEQGKLSMQDKVAKYFPNLTRANDITLLDLGGHLSGYRDYYPLDYVDREMLQAASADTIINRYARRPLDFEPRSRYSYSNTGFLILGRVVEQVSGQPFGTFVSQHIFTPLALTRTAYEPDWSATSNMARGYTSFALSDPIPAEPEAKGWAGMAGAIWSTPSDLLTWDTSLLNHTLISPASYATLTTAQRLSDGRSSGYGCGEGVGDRGQAVILRHGGAVSGFVAQNTVIPSTHSAVVLLSNSDFSPIDELNQTLVSMLIPQVDVPAVHGLSALDAARKFLMDLSRGAADRATLSDDFNAYLTPTQIALGQRSLNALGAVSNVSISGLYERGGMEVAVVTFDVGNTPARGLMYRDPDGKIEEFLFSRR